MKTYSLLFLFIPFFCFAQENRKKATTTKPSTTDCPTWKKKDKSPGKAEYFQYLRTAKPQPRTQNNFPATTDSKIQPTTVQQKTKNAEQTKEKKPSIQRTKENQTTTADKSQKIEKRITTVLEDKTSVSSTAEEKHKEPSEKAKKEEKISAVAAEKKSEDKKVITEITDKSPSETSEKLDEEKTKLKQKLTRLTRKTTKVRRHNNSKCPSF